jgi:hypothetical protein
LPFLKQKFEDKSRWIIFESIRNPENLVKVSFGSVDELISTENQVIFLDAFADKLDLDKLQFKIKELNSEGRPPFPPKFFLRFICMVTTWAC